MDLYEYLPKEKAVFEEFCKFLFTKFNKNKEKFRKFNGFPDTYKIPLIIEFLETKGVPFLTAMTYYNYKHTGTPFFMELVKFTIICEFKRIEKNIKITYIPF